LPPGTFALSFVLLSAFPRTQFLLFRGALLGLCVFLAQCTSYQPLSLDDGQPAIDTLGRVEIDPRAMPTAALQAYRFDSSDGLDMTEVAMVAVTRNPDLRLARDDLGIARAQAFSAGLLPDPQIGIESDYPAPGPAGATRAFTYGLSIDMMAILQRGDNQHAADATVAKTDLGLLWQEWQVIAQARQLYLKAVYADEVMPLLVRQRELSAGRYQRIAAAVGAHDQPADVLSVALTAMQDADKQLADAQRQRVQTRHDLNALLGIVPAVELPLAGPAAVAPVDPHVVEEALHQLARQRPDLLALEAGYTAQQAKYRGAILGQFPNLTVGFVRTRDTSNVYTSGFQVNLSLPVFNRNRGNIEIEQATRGRLHDEYQNRLAQAQSDVDRLLADTAVLGRQLAGAQAALPLLDQAARMAQQAYDRHDLAIGAYTDAQTAALAKRIEAETLSESLAEQRIALQALLGDGIPADLQPDLTYTTTHADS
jgi:outer membrane protein TolC